MKSEEMDEETKTLLKNHLNLLEEKTKTVTDIQDLVRLSEQICKISSVLLSKNYK